MRTEVDWSYDVGEHKLRITRTRTEGGEEEQVVIVLSQPKMVRLMRSIQYCLTTPEVRTKVIEAVAAGKRRT